MIRHPGWFGLRYPSFDDLVEYATSLGCRGGRADIGDNGLFIAGGPEPPVILLPLDKSPLRDMWILSHEIGHLVKHPCGPKGELTYSRDEWRANRWAACALIPESRIMLHQNACPDAFIGALSAHYEDLPLHNCPARKLAGMIAAYRIRSLEVCA